MRVGKGNQYGGCTFLGIYLYCNSAISEDGKNINSINVQLHIYSQDYKRFRNIKIASVSRSRPLACFGIALRKFDT